MILKTLHKTAWLSAGTLFLTLAIIGLLLPIVPQVPFLLIAIICFMRCSQRFRRWLSRQHWFVKLHGWTERSRWLKPLQKHLHGAKH